MNVFDGKPQGLCRQVGSDSLIPTLMLKILRLLKLIWIWLSYIWTEPGALD